MTVALRFGGEREWTRFESTFDAPKHAATTAAYAQIGYSRHAAGRATPACGATTTATSGRMELRRRRAAVARRRLERARQLRRRVQGTEPVPAVLRLRQPGAAARTQPELRPRRGPGRSQRLWAACRRDAVPPRHARPDRLCQLLRASDWNLRGSSVRYVRQHRPRAGAGDRGRGRLPASGRPAAERGL